MNFASAAVFRGRVEPVRRDAAHTAGLEEEGVVTLAWNDPAYTAARHGITDQDDNIALIAGALANLAAGAAGDDGMGDE